MITLLNKVSEKSWQILFIGLSVAVGTLPIALTILVINTGGIQYKTDSREIYLNGKTKQAASKNKEQTEDLKLQLEELTSSYNELARAARRRKVDGILRPQIEQVEKDIIKSETKLDEVAETQAQLKELVEETIVNP